MANKIKIFGPNSLKVLCNKIVASLNNCVKKEEGKGLTTNDYSTDEKNKLYGIETGANHYVHPAYSAKTSGLYKVTVDNKGHVSGTAAVAKSDITSLGIPAQDTVYTHPTNAGYKHIPAGGQAGQILNWKASGEAQWSNAMEQTDITGNAGTATKLKTARTIDGVDFDGSATISHFGICELSPTHQNRSVNIPGFSMAFGAKVSILFRYGIAVENSTLNVSSTGPIAIYYKGHSLPYNYVKAGTVVDFVYDGSYWQVIGNLTEDRVDTIETTYAKKTDNVASATKLQTARAIDGVTFDGSTAMSHYGICDTEGGTLAKTVSITGFTLVTGARVMVRFTYANTVSSPKLNVSGTGAKEIRYKNAAIPTTYIKAYSLLELVYDNTYWRVVGDLTQSQVDTVNTSLANYSPLRDQTVLYSGQFYADAVNTVKYTTVSGLSAYKMVLMHCEVGDAYAGALVFTPQEIQQKVGAITATTYFGRASFYCDFAYNRIGVQVHNKPDGWNMTAFRITKVYGILK